MKNRCTHSSCRAQLPKGATRCPKCHRRTGRAPTKANRRTLRFVEKPTEPSLVLSKGYLEMYQAGEWYKAVSQLVNANPKRPSLLWIRDNHEILWNGHGASENDHSKHGTRGREK